MMNADALLRAARQGDERAKQELVRYLIAELHCHFGYSHQDADTRDLTQRVLMLVLAKLDTYEEREGQTLRQWVIGFARREAKYARRQRGRDGRLAARYAAVQPTPPHPTGPATLLERKLRRKRAKRVMRQLATPFREAIQNDLDGGTAKTLAERRGVSLDNAYVIRSRARKAFHRLLEKTERVGRKAAAQKSTPPPS